MNLIKFKTIEYVVYTIGNTQKFGLDSMIAIMSFIVSVFALYTTRKIYRVLQEKFIELMKQKICIRKYLKMIY
jgi:hypothetical protein